MGSIDMMSLWGSRISRTRHASTVERRGHLAELFRTQEVVWLLSMACPLCDLICLWLSTPIWHFPASYAGVRKATIAGRSPLALDSILLTLLRCRFDLRLTTAHSYPAWSARRAEIHKWFRSKVISLSFSFPSVVMEDPKWSTQSKSVKES